MVNIILFLPSFKARSPSGVNALVPNNASIALILDAKKLYSSITPDIFGWRKKYERFRIMFGAFWSLIFQAEKGFGAAEPRIIESSSMPFFGSFERAPRGVIYRPITADGATLIGDLFAGETRESGKNCSKNSLSILILSGL